MTGPKSLHGPSIDDLVWLQGFDQMDKRALWQLLYQVMLREGEVKEAQNNVPLKSIAYWYASAKLKALKQLHLTIWSTIYPKFNGCILVGMRDTDEFNNEKIRF